MSEDPELKAMGDVLSALETLEDDESKQRVLDWVAGRLGLVLKGKPPHGADEPGGGVSPPGQEDTVGAESST